jgi:hypothetical protein
MRKTSLFLAIISTVAVSLAVIVWLGTVVSAQSTKVEGLIKARNGETMTVRTSNTPTLSLS